MLCAFGERLSSFISQFASVFMSRATQGIGDILILYVLTWRRVGGR